jgi:hypothetical protein
MEPTRSQTRQFFDLPRELRDEIYKYCYHVTPHTCGALRGYADIPSSALLRTCKQVYQEASPIFHSGLKAVLLHDRVRIKLPSDSEGVVRHAGWTRISNERFDIWVRNGPEADTEVEWFVYLSHIWQGGVRDAELERSADEGFILWAKLDSLSKLFLAQHQDKEFSRIGRRLHSLQSRVCQVAKKVEQKEATRKASVCNETGKKELKESQSQPSGFDVQQGISFVHHWQSYGSVAVRAVRAQTETGSGNQG